jgi:hypothetical protein
MSEDRGAELFRALHAIIDAVTNLNLRDLEAEAKASSSSSAEEGTSSKASARGKGVGGSVKHQSKQGSKPSCRG